MFAVHTSNVKSEVSIEIVVGAPVGGPATGLLNRLGGSKIHFPSLAPFLGPGAKRQQKQCLRSNRHAFGTLYSPISIPTTAPKRPKNV
jgi:hypothetical protein